MQTIFGKQKVLANLLDESLRQIPMEPENLYMNIYRFPETNWELICEIGNNYFSCLVSAKSLSLQISKGVKVNEFIYKKFAQICILTLCSMRVLSFPNLLNLMKMFI